MFNWKPNVRKEEYNTRMDVLNEWQINIQKRIDQIEIKWERDRADIWKAIKDLSEASAKELKPFDPSPLEQKLAVLETWRAQLHSLLVERGNTGKEKLSKTGNALAKFYGR